FNPSESDTFIYCMSGQITLNLGKEIYQAQEEDVLYFKARDNHRLSNESNNETRILIVATASYL
ncbi:cupin domain-containing protein, partial [Staphylococcus aureus]|nr:cupin domain-containing protein [Staphylococcus aureus]